MGHQNDANWCSKKHVKDPWDCPAQTHGSFTGFGTPLGEPKGAQRESKGAQSRPNGEPGNPKMSQLCFWAYVGISQVGGLLAVSRVRASTTSPKERKPLRCEIYPGEGPRIKPNKPKQTKVKSKTCLLGSKPLPYQQAPHQCSPSKKRVPSVDLQPVRTL